MIDNDLKSELEINEETYLKNLSCPWIKTVIFGEKARRMKLT